MLFTGEYRRSIDEKGRLIVPSSMRELIPGEGTALARGVDGCIDLWPEGEWERQAQDILAQPRSSEARREFIRRVAGKSHTDQIDKQGRITVPQQLRDYAGITADVVIVGVFDHVEIWDPIRYAAIEEKQEETPLEEQLKQLNI